MALSEFSENASLAMEEKKEIKINLTTKQDLNQINHLLSAVERTVTMSPKKAQALMNAHKCQVYGCEVNFKAGYHCKASYCCFNNLGCGKKLCPKHVSNSKWIMQSKHKRKGWVRPTVCTNCEPKVRKFFITTFILMGLLVLMAIGSILVIIWTITKK